MVNGKSCAYKSGTAVEDLGQFLAHHHGKRKPSASSTISTATPKRRANHQRRGDRNVPLQCLSGCDEQQYR